MHAHRHAAGVGVADFDVQVGDHRAPGEPHRTHADGVAEVFQFQFQRRDFRVGVAVADHAQTRRLFAERHARVLRAAQAHADNRRLACQAALAESDEGVEQKPLDAVHAVAGKQHAVVGAEQAAFMHGGEFQPVGARLKTPVDFRREHADIVVRVGAPQRMHAVRAQRNVAGGARGGDAQRLFQRHHAALDARLVADLDIVTRQPGVGAHRPPVGACGVVVLQHGLQHKARQPLLARRHAGHRATVVLRNIDGGVMHDLMRRAFDGVATNHFFMRLRLVFVFGAGLRLCNA